MRRWPGSTIPTWCGSTDVDEHEGLPFLVMEWVDGGDLAHRLRRPVAVRETSRRSRCRWPGPSRRRTIRGSSIATSSPATSFCLSSARHARPVGAGWRRRSATSAWRSWSRMTAVPRSAARCVGTPSYMAPEQTGLLDGIGAGAGHRHLRPGRDPLRDAGRPSAVRRQLATRDDPPGRRGRRRPAPTPAAGRPSRPGDDLPEVPGARSRPAIRDREGARRGTRAVPGRPPDPGTPGRRVGTRRVGAGESPPKRDCSWC